MFADASHVLDLDLPHLPSQDLLRSNVDCLPVGGDGLLRLLKALGCHANKHQRIVVALVLLQDTLSYIGNNL